MKNSRRFPASLLSPSASCLKEFTLIELLVVVAIIAILAGMLLPALNQARDKAKQIKCTGNYKSISSAMFLYVNDFNEYLPGPSIGCARRSRSYAGGNFIKALDERYIRSIKSERSAADGGIWYCPAGGEDFFNKMTDTSSKPVAALNNKGYGEADKRHNWNYPFGYYKSNTVTNQKKINCFSMPIYGQVVDPTKIPIYAEWNKFTGGVETLLPLHNGYYTLYYADGHVGSSNTTIDWTPHVQ